MVWVKCGLGQMLFGRNVIGSSVLGSNVLGSYVTGSNVADPSQLLNCNLFLRKNQSEIISII